MTIHDEYYDESAHRAWTGVDERDDGAYRHQVLLHQQWPDLYPHPDELREIARAS